MLLCFRFVIDVRFAVEPGVTHVACTGVGGIIVFVPSDVGEMHERQHFACIVPLDEVWCSGSCNVPSSTVAEVKV